MTGADRPPAEGAPRRFRAVLAYAGTRYAGFQRQAGETRTVQGALETALAQVTRQTVRVLAAGRTDAGVHATGQVIAFDVAWEHPPEALRRALNAALPADIALQTLDEAAADFHPRYDARSRIYTYTFYAAPARQPLLDNQAWQVPAPQLDLPAMQQAAALLLGTHDFATFGQPPQGENTVRTVWRSAVALAGPLVPQGQLFRYTIEADAFLYRMVRRIVGALVRVGSAQLTPEALAAALAAADGTWPNQSAPARGLCLIQVTY